MRPMPERGPDLLAVDDEVVTVSHRSGAQRGEIGSGFGLRHPLAPDVVGAHHPGEQRRLLGFGAVLHDRGSDVVQPNDVERHGSPSARGFLGVDQLLEHRRSAATVVARPGDRGPPRVRHRLVPGTQHFERRVVAASGASSGDQLSRQICGQPVAQLGAELFHFRWVGEVHCPFTLVPGRLAGLYGRADFWSTMSMRGKQRSAALGFRECDVGVIRHRVDAASLTHLQHLVDDRRGHDEFVRG